jgi:hypothetical protein
MGVVRAILPILPLLGLGGAWAANLTDVQISGGVTAALVLFTLASTGITMAWSRYDKWETARKDHQTSVASAVATHAAGTPLTVAQNVYGVLVSTPVPLAEQVQATAFPPKAA